MSELNKAIGLAELRLNAPCAPNQRNTAVNSDDLRIILSAASAAPDFAEASSDAAEIIERYAAFIRDYVSADELEMHPYLPSIEDAARGLRTAIARAKGESA